MTDNPDLWQVRTLPGGVVLELQTGDEPAPVLAQGADTIRTNLAHVEEVAATLADAAADLAEVLAAGGVYHA